MLLVGFVYIITLNCCCCCCAYEAIKTTHTREACISVCSVPENILQIIYNIFGALQYKCHKFTFVSHVQ